MARCAKCGADKCESVMCGFFGERVEVSPDTRIGEKRRDPRRYIPVAVFNTESLKGF